MTTLTQSILWAGKVRALHEGDENALPRALADLAQALGPADWALVGGMAVGFHARPRGTQDIDVLFISEGKLNQLAPELLASGNFTRHRSHAVEHRGTGVEVEMLSPEFLNFPASIAQRAVETATPQQFGSYSIPVVSRDALVALKLQRHSRADQGDIERIIQAGGAVDLSGYELPPGQLALYQEIEREVLQA